MENPLSKDQSPIILAFSGGLDTSFCVPWLKEQYGRDVITACVDTGGIDEEAARSLHERSRALGAIEHFGRSWEWCANAFHAYPGYRAADDPLLTNRSGQGKQPARVVLDSRLALPLESQLVRTASQAPVRRRRRGRPGWSPACSKRSPTRRCPPGRREGNSCSLRPSPR